MIRLIHKGNADSTIHKLKRMKAAARAERVDKFARDGLEALEANTPVDSGITSKSWSYDISKGANSTSITYSNSNINRGVSIAMIRQLGHGTGTGGWVEGKDYINPALEPVFQNAVNEIWEEVTKV